MEKPMDMKSVILKILIASLVIGALLAIYAILSGDFGDFESRILGTNISMGIASLLALASSVSYEKEKFRFVAYGGICSAMIAFVLSVLLIWEFLIPESSRFSETLYKIFEISLVLSIVFAHSSILLTGSGKEKTADRIISGTIFFSVIASVQIITLIITEIRPEEFFFRLLGSFGVLIVLGTILTPIFLKISSMKK